MTPASPPLPPAAQAPEPGGGVGELGSRTGGSGALHAFFEQYR